MVNNNIERVEGEDRYLCSSVRGLIKNNRKIRVCFQFVSSSFVRGCSNYLTRTEIDRSFRTMLSSSAVVSWKIDEYDLLFPSGIYLASSSLCAIKQCIFSLSKSTRLTNFTKFLYIQVCLGCLRFLSRFYVTLTSMRCVTPLRCHATRTTTNACTYSIRNLNGSSFEFLYNTAMERFTFLYNFNDFKIFLTEPVYSYT